MSLQATICITLASIKNDQLYKTIYYTYSKTRLTENVFPPTPIPNLNPNSNPNPKAQ